MKLTIIAAQEEKGFQYAKRFGLDGVEFCVNIGRDTREVTAHTEELKTLSEAYKLPVVSVGRWGALRLREDGSVDPEEQAHDFRLIDFAAALGCKNFECGCNAIPNANFYERTRAAIEYIKTLVAYAKNKNVNVNVVNCDWNNCIYDKSTWDLIFPQIPELGLKYDASHCINRDGDYLTEMIEYGHLIRHFHLKGTVRVKGRNIPDPSAGFDHIQWGSIMAILYHHKYDGALSIEPHSGEWNKGALAEFGIRFTVDMIRKYMIPEGFTGQGGYMPGRDE